MYSLEFFHTQFISVLSLPSEINRNNVYILNKPSLCCILLYISLVDVDIPFLCIQYIHSGNRASRLSVLQRKTRALSSIV